MVQMKSMKIREDDIDLLDEEEQEDEYGDELLDDDEYMGNKKG
jgi:hypothetical protein